MPAFLLFLLFLALKLTGVIAWSWLWVTAPLWAGFALWLVMLVLIFVVALIGGATTRGRINAYSRSLR